VTGDHPIPAARDLPAQRLEERRQHLLSEIASAPTLPLERPRWLGRRRVVVLAAVLVVAVGATTAFAVRDLLSGSATNAGGPMWSPDGRKIAYTVCRWPDEPCEVYVMNADGSGQRNLTDAWGPDVFPTWSPDWRRILFVRNPCAPTRRACTGTTQIYEPDAASK
jgi:hypothetical protein